MDKPTSPRASHSASSSARTCSDRPQVCGQGAPHPSPPASSTRPKHPPKPHSKIAPLCAEFAIRPRQCALVGKRGAVRASVQPTKALCPRSPRRLAVCAVRRRLEPARGSLACHPWPRHLFVTGNMPPSKPYEFAAWQKACNAKMHREANGAASFAGRRAMIFDRLIPTYVSPRAHPEASASARHPSQSHQSHCAYAFGSSKGSGPPKAPVPTACSG